MIARYNRLCFVFGVPGIIIQTAAMVVPNMLGPAQAESASPIVGLGGLVGTAHFC